MQLTAIDPAEVARKRVEVAGELLKTNDDCEHVGRCDDRKCVSRILSHKGMNRALGSYCCCIVDARECKVQAHTDATGMHA